MFIIFLCLLLANETGSIGTYASKIAYKTGQQLQFKIFIR